MINDARPPTAAAMRLLLRGSQAFTRIEEAGLRIDTGRLHAAVRHTKARIARLEEALKNAHEYKVWLRLYGNDMRLEAPIQLGRVIFDELGHKRNPFLKKTEKGSRDRNSVAAFEHLKLPFLRDYQEVKRLKKALSTYLLGLERDTVNGYVHPSQNLHTAESYRSSSDRPNFHNFPVRNQDIAALVRSCVVPRPGHVFLTADYKTHEVKVSYCYNQDPNLRQDILTGDMHYDRSLELYCLSRAQLGEGGLIRYCVKNRFVFAQFYGSAYFQCAPDLWDAISIFGLKTTEGVPLYEHLKSRGITELGACDPSAEPPEGTFEHHVRTVERGMWARYGIYDRWRRDWWSLYLARGWAPYKTGFRMDGIFRKNQVLCDPIQGSAFHCLLWTIIETQNEVLRRKMKARIVDQVHDSTLWDLPRGEVADVVEIIKDYGTRRIARAWPWLIIPLGVDFEFYPHDWFHKEKLEAL